MNKLRTVVSVIIMVIAAIIGLYVGQGLDGAILFAVIAGIACVIYTLDNREN